MSNGNPDSPSHACADTFIEDVLGTFSWVDDYQLEALLNNGLQDAIEGNVISNLDGAVASCETQPGTLVYLRLESVGIGLQSPPSTLALDQPPCAEADFLGTLHNCAAQGAVYGDAPYPLQSSGFSASDNITFGYLGDNSVLNQYAVNRTSPSSILLSNTHPDAAQILDVSVLKHGASPKSDRSRLEQKPYRCELQITKADPPFEQTICGKTFARSKDLKRHKSTVHKEDNDPVYLCRCGKDDPRKDNHARHIGVCEKEPCVNSPYLGSYVCKCSHLSKEQYDHLEHVKSCSPGKRSRKRHNASWFGAWDYALGRAKVVCVSMVCFDVVSVTPLLRQSDLMIQ